MARAAGGLTVGAGLAAGAGSLFAGQRVYRSIVGRQVTAVFDALSRGDASVALSGSARDVHHIFAGEHALGGERHSVDALQQWFARLFRLVAIDFEIVSITVAGPPWDTVAAVEWIGHVTPQVGAPYDNHGAHVIRLRFARVVEIHAYEDSQKVAEALQQMAGAGIEEAAAPPIA